MSQLDFAVEAEISSKHLSFLETGRSQPSRDMVLHLAELLDVPLRERNTLLIAAGFAPMFGEHALSDPELQRRARSSRARAERSRALPGDRGRSSLDAGRSKRPRELLHGRRRCRRCSTPPINVLRISLASDGMAPRIVNLAEWRAHLFARLRRQIEVSADAMLVELLEELSEYPAPAHAAELRCGRVGRSSVPFRLATDAGVLSFISTTTVFGTPIDVTLSELALESFFPADAATAAVLRHSHNNEFSLSSRRQHRVPDQYTAGPWGPMQHGGAPTRR